MPKTPDDEPEVTEAELLEDFDDGSAPRPPADLAVAMESPEGRLHPILSNEEFRAAEAKAVARMVKEDKTAAAKAVEEEMIEKVRGKRGLVTGNSTLDELVEIHMDLAEYTDHIRINNTIYMHGATYTVPRHVADSMREMQSRTHVHQMELDGKSTSDRFRVPHNTLVSRHGVQNAPQPLPQAVA